MPAIASLVVRHVVIPAIFGGRSQRIVSLSCTRPTWLLQAHVLHACSGALHTQVPQLRLEVLDVAAAVLDLPVQAREHGRVVGRLAHGIGGVDQGPLPVNLALHVGNGLVDARHGGGRLSNSAGRAVVRLSADGCGEVVVVPGDR